MSTSSSSSLSYIYFDGNTTGESSKRATSIPSSLLHKQRPRKTPTVRNPPHNTSIEMEPLLQDIPTTLERSEKFVLEGQRIIRLLKESLESTKKLLEQRQELDKLYKAWEDSYSYRDNRILRSTNHLSLSLSYRKRKAVDDLRLSTPMLKCYKLQIDLIATMTKDIDILFPLLSYQHEINEVNEICKKLELQQLSTNSGGGGTKHNKKGYSDRHDGRRDDDEQEVDDDDTYQRRGKKVRREVDLQDRPPVVTTETGSFHVISLTQSVGQLSLEANETKNKSGK